MIENMTDTSSSSTRIKKKLPFPPRTLQTEETFINRSHKKIGSALLAFSEETPLDTEILKIYPKIQPTHSFWLAIIVMSLLLIISLGVFFMNSLIWSRHKKIIV